MAPLCECNAWFKKGTPTVTKERNSLPSDVNFGPLLTPASSPFSYLCFVLSCLVFVLFCLILEDRQTER
jgi:hypothetical protein